jgi:hypothetical protein
MNAFSAGIIGSGIFSLQGQYRERPESQDAWNVRAVLRALATL